MTVEGQIWEALRHVEDPEIPISVVGMGLIVSVRYDDGVADLEITFTVMGCPAMDFIEDDIREAVLAIDEIHTCNIETVWDPVWTKNRIRAESRETMRKLGVVV
jgi:metal-sulfur cluster biosynthetic enzyme